MKNKLLSAIMALGVLSTSIIAPMNVCAVTSDIASASAGSENESNTTTYPVATTIGTTTTVAETSEQEGNDSLYGFSVAPSELSLSVGDTYKLNVTFKGNNYYENSVVFSSSKSRIASVSSEGIVTALEEGSTTMKISAKVNDEKIKLDENESIVKTLYVKVNVSPDKSLTAEQNELLSQLKEKGNRLIGEFQRKEKEIRGEFDENSPRVTMNDVENIISESDTYQEIMNKLQMIQKYPDFIGGSGVTIVEYWFDDYGYQKLLLILEQEDAIYVKCNDSGKITDWHLIFPIKKDISFESYQTKMIGSFNIYNNINASDTISNSKPVQITTTAVTETNTAPTITMPVIDEPNVKTLIATVKIMDVSGDTILVKPVDGSTELKSSDEFILSAKQLPADIKPQSGMILEIAYNAGILETYPGKFGNIQKITVVTEANTIKEDATMLKGTKDMTLKDVIELAKKGNDLDWADFKDYNGRDIGSGLYIWEYKLEDGYVLDVGGDVMKKPLYILLSHNDEKGIDIRTDDVKEYIAASGTPVATGNEEVKSVMLTTESGYEGCYVHLDLMSGTFTMSGSMHQNFAVFGKFERKGNNLYLYGENGSTNVYILHRDGSSLISQSDEKGINLTKGLAFSAENDAFWEKLASTNESTVKGDANCDSDVNMSDAVIIMQSLANPAKYGVNGTDKNHITEQGKKNADIAGENDGITNADALAIQKKLLDLYDENTLSVDESPIATDAGFTTKDGKRVSFGLYDKLCNNTDTDVEIAITPDYGVDYNYEYNGKTINQYHNEWDEDSALFEKYGQIVKQGDKLKYGEALYTTGTPDGEKWDKDFYYQRVSFYGEEFLAKYIVNGEFLIDKVLADQAAHQDEHKTTNHAYKALHEAIDAYNYEKIQATIPQLENQNIRYEYNETQKSLIFYVTAAQFEKLSLDNVSSYGLASSGSVVD